MEKTPKKMLNAYVDSQKFNSTTKIMVSMKEMFRDVLRFDTYSKNVDISAFFSVQPFDTRYVHA